MLRKGEWRKLPSRRQRWLARYTLAMPFLQAATGVLLPLSLVSMFLLKVPVPTALVTFFRWRRRSSRWRSNLPHSVSSDGNSAFGYVPAIKRDYCWAPFRTSCSFGRRGSGGVA